MAGTTRLVKVVGNNTEVVGTDFKTQSNPTGFTATGTLRQTNRHGQASAEKGTKKTSEFTSMQQVSEESGIKTDSHLVVCGSDFSGDPQRGAEKALRQLSALLSQRGDNAGQVKPGSLPTIDFKKLASSATAGWSGALSPQLPQITRIDEKEIAEYVGACFSFVQTFSLGNVAYQTGVATRAELQRQVEQQKLTWERLLQQFSPDQITTDMASGTPSLQDRDAESNITRQLILENYIPYLANLINHEQQMT